MLHPLQERARWAYIKKLQRERDEREKAHRRWMEDNRVLLQELLEIDSQELAVGVGGITLDYDRNTATVDGMTFLFRASLPGAGFRDSATSIHLLPTRELMDLCMLAYQVGPDGGFDPFPHYSRAVHSLEDVGQHLCNFEPHYL